MFAIVDIQGQQFKVEKNQYVYVHRLPNAEGENIVLDKVMLVSEGNNTQIGAPYVAGTKISAKVLNHLKGDKVIVFKKKRRKGYKVKNGHRQYLTKIQIESIG
jgi:large subunit ribosomal protein L21